MKRVLKNVVATVLAIVCCITIFTGCVTKTNEQLYLESVQDAKVASPDEIRELVVLTKDSDMATFDDSDRVLLLSWHKYPGSYVAGQTTSNVWGELWAFTDKEILSWYDKNSNGVTDWELRLEQLIGLPVETEYTHVTAMWVNVEDVIRPAFVTSVTEQVTEQSLDDSMLGEHQEWFENNTESSYSDDYPYPWTRLGYTYDWEIGIEEYGLSEFLVLKNSELLVEWTYSNQEFINWLENN